MTAPGPLAAYLRARAADADGAGAIALAGYARALEATPPDAGVAGHAYREAVAAGDLALLDRAAMILNRAGRTPADAALFPLARAAAAGDLAAFRTASAALGRDRLRVLVPALADLVATSPFAALPVDPAARRLVQESRALRILAHDRGPEALAAIRPLLGRGARASGFAIAAAERLIAAGRDADAALILRNDRAALIEAQAGAATPATLGYGVSRLLLRVADDLSGDRAEPVAIALVRAALVADPGYARAHLVLADRLTDADDFSRAEVELDRLAAGPLARFAAARRVALLARADRLAEALAAARPLAEAVAATAVDRARYADLLVAADRPAAALPWYRAIVDDPPGRDNAAAWLHYGSALDAAGRWPEAKKALRRAVRIAPDEPAILNQLGYTMVDRGDDVVAGTRLLERAHALAADDAAIADSLGWAYYRGGAVARALPLVERSAAALPADPDVADHLGDLYWTLGRRYEARYRWRAALLTAPADRAASLNAKLAGGLPR